MTKNSTKNIGDDWKGIEENRREKGRKNLKGSTKKRRKKLKKKEQRNGMKKMKWERWGIYIMSCRKSSG